MAKWGEMNLQKFKAYLDSLRGARQGAESRGMQTMAGFQNIQGGIDKLLALGESKRGREHDVSMLTKEYGLRGDEAGRERKYRTGERVAGQEYGVGERVAGQEFKAGEALLDRASRVKIAAMRGDGGVEDRMAAAYDAAWNAVITAHPEMWETGQFQWRRDNAEIVTGEFQNQLRRFKLGAADEEILMDAFRALLVVQEEAAAGDNGETEEPRKIATATILRQLSAEQLVEQGYASNIITAHILKITGIGGKEKEKIGEPTEQEKLELIEELRSGKFQFY